MCNDINSVRHILWKICFLYSAITYPTKLILTDLEYMIQFMVPACTCIICKNDQLNNCKNIMHLTNCKPWLTLILCVVFMAWYFSEQIRQNDRVIRKGQRDITRERNDLERQEKKIVSTCRHNLLLIINNNSVKL